MRFLYPVIFVAALSYAADTRIVTPSAGFVYDAAARSVRPINGMPGAALIGDPVDVGFPVARATISASRKYMLAVSAEDGALRVVALDGSGARDIAGVLPAFTHMALSPSGSAAVLYDEAAERIQTVSGLPESPEVRREFSTASLGKALALPAVSDDGALVLFPADSLWRLDTDAGFSATPMSAAAVSFRAGSHDAVAATASGEIYRLSSGGHSRLWRAGETGGTVAVRISADGARAYAVFAGGTLSSIDTATGEARSVSCGCKPAALDPLQLPAVFRITDLSDAPLMLLDVSGAEPRVWFVPAARQGSEE